MKLPVLNADGKELKTLEVDDSVFGIEPNGAVLHQAFVAQRANQRWGTAQTKTRGEVQGSTRKMRMQKYSGRARQGSNRAPHRVGGGTVFGPRLRDYSKALPKKMRRLAIRSALSGKVASGELKVIDALTFETPKTREIVRILHNVGIQRSALIVTAAPDRTVLASIRNLDRTKLLPANYLNVADMLNHQGMLMTEEAVRLAESLWGAKAADGRRPAPVAAPKPAPRRRAPTKAESPVAQAPVTEAPAAPEAAPARPRRRAAPKAAEETAAPVAKPEAVREKPRRARKAPQPEAAAPTPETPEADAKPRRQRRAAQPKAAAEPPGAGEPTAEEQPKPRRRNRKTEGEE